jgi:hypothetical protein
MSTKILTTTLAAFACAAVVSAQAPPPAQPPAPPSAPPAAQRPPDTRAASADNLTVTGCVERSASASNAPGAAGNPAAPGGSESSRFILTKAMKPTGTAGSSSAAPAPSSYQLDADDSKLTAHVGQKVEIKGTIAERSSSASKGGSSSDAPRLKVDSVKMVAATCSE